MFENCSSWPPVKVSRFRPFLSYIENPWALGPISKCEGPRWAHSWLYWRVLRAILFSLTYRNRGFPQNCSSWPPITLFPISLIQHPPFFSEMRTFSKNRPPWLKFYFNSSFNHGGRFLTHPKTKKVFFPIGILSQIGRCRF